MFLTSLSRLIRLEKKTFCGEIIFKNFLILQTGVKAAHSLISVQSLEYLQPGKLRRLKGGDPKLKRSSSKESIDSMASIDSAPSTIGSGSTQFDQVCNELSLSCYCLYFL